MAGSPGQPVIGAPSQFLCPTLSQTVFPVAASSATMPGFPGCPPTMISSNGPSTIGLLPAPKNAGGTSHSEPVSRCQTSLPVCKFQAGQLPFRAKSVAAIGHDQRSGGAARCCSRTDQ